MIVGSSAVCNNPLMLEAKNVQLPPKIIQKTNDFNISVKHNYRMQKGNIKVRRSLNRCAEKENVADLNLNNMHRDRNNLSIPSLTMRQSKLPHLEPSQEVRKLVQKRTKPHQEDIRRELRKASVTMVINPSKPQSFKHITLTPIVL